MKPPTARIAAALLLASFCFVSGCTTQHWMRPGNESVEELFNRADKNGDGRVSRDEFADLLIEEAFARYDSNGNGYVTLAEYTSGGGTVADFHQIDRSGRGKFSLEDAKACKLVRDRMSSPFDGADTKRTGYLTRAQFQAYREAAAPYTR